MIALPLYIFYLVELAIISYFDIKTRKIKNHWSLINIAAAIISYIIFTDLFPFELLSFKLPSIFFFVGFGLYWVRIMGAGDVKFISSFFLLIPPGMHLVFFDGLIFSTIAIGSILFMINTAKHFKFVIICIRTKSFGGLKILLGKKFSYAPVIFLAWIYLGYHQFH